MARPFSSCRSSSCSMGTSCNQQHPRALHRVDQTMPNPLLVRWFLAVLVGATWIGSVARAVPTVPPSDSTAKPDPAPTGTDAATKPGPATTRESREARQERRRRERERNRQIDPETILNPATSRPVFDEAIKAIEKYPVAPDL